MRHQRSRFRTGAVAFALLMSSVPAKALTLQLAERLAAPGNNEVKLHLVSQQPADPSAVTASPITLATSDDSAYSLALINVTHKLGTRFFTYEFLAWKNTAPGDKTEFQVNVWSTGSFADFSKEVPFTVIDGNAKGTGAIELPVHPVDPASVCKVVDGVATIPTAQKPLPVFLGGETEHVVSLNCGETPYLARIISINAPKGRPAYWNRVVFDSSYYGAGKPAKPVISKSFDLMTVQLTPDIFNAIGARFRRFSVSDAPDDTITIDVSYAIQQGGLETPLKIELPVTFFPSPTVIVGSLSAGVTLGWLVTLLLLRASSRPNPGKIWAALLLGELLAVVACALALIAYGANCRVKIFGVDLNPFDWLILFVGGVLCGWAALIKTDGLLDLLNRIGDKIGIGKPRQVAAGAVLLAFLAGASARADDDLNLIGLSACPKGEIVGLQKNGTVVRFAGLPSDKWRPAGKLDAYMTPLELTCSEVDNKTTVFVVATALNTASLVRMDLATGGWRSQMVIDGTGGGLAFDPGTASLYVTLPATGTIYRMPSNLRDGAGWASLFGGSESLGALALHPTERRLLVAEAFSGTLYSVSLDNQRRQDRFAQGFSSVNSIGIDRSRSLLYVADSLARTIWVVPLSGDPKPKVFDKSDVWRAATGVAVDLQSNVWIGLTGGKGVRVLNPAGRPIKKID